MNLNKSSIYPKNTVLNVTYTMYLDKSAIKDKRKRRRANASLEKSLITSIKMLKLKTIDFKKTTIIDAAKMLNISKGALKLYIKELFIPKINKHNIVEYIHTDIIKLSPYNVKKICNILNITKTTTHRHINCKEIEKKNILEESNKNSNAIDIIVNDLKNLKLEPININSTNYQDYTYLEEINYNDPNQFLVNYDYLKQRADELFIYLTSNTTTKNVLEYKEIIEDINNFIYDVITFVEHFENNKKDIEEIPEFQHKDLTYENIENKILILKDIGTILTNYFEQIELLYNNDNEFLLN